MTGIDITAAKNAAREALETTTTWSPMHCVDVIVDAALPHILAQVEARVKPSREDVARVIESDAWTLSDDDYFEAYDDGMRGVGYCLQMRSGRRKASLKRADAVLALLPGRTEQGVREEVAREHEEKMDRLLEGEWQAGYVAGNNDQLNGTICGRRRAANEGIARGGAGCGQCRRVDGTHKLDCTARGGERG